MMIYFIFQQLICLLCELLKVGVQWETGSWTQRKSQSRIWQSQ